MWFDNINKMHDKIALMVRAFMTDTIPEALYGGQKEVKEMYKEEDSRKAFVEYLKEIVDKRKKSIEMAIMLGEHEINPSDKNVKK